MAQAVERLRQAAESAAQAKQTATETKPTETAPKALSAKPEETNPPAESETTAEPEAKSTPAEGAPENTTTTEGETEKGDEAEDPVLSPKSSLTPEQREVLQKRIDKEVAKRYKLKGEFDAKIEALQKQVQELGQKAQPAQAEQKAPPAPSSDPLPHIKSEADLLKLRDEAKSSLRWAEEQLDYDNADEREAITINGEQVKPSNAMLKRIMRNARETLDESIPAKLSVFQHHAQAIQKAAENRKLAMERFPFLSKPDSAEFKLAQQVYQSNPWLQNSPEGELYAAAIARGLTPAEKAELKAKEEPKAAPVAKVTPKAPSDQAPVSTAGGIQRLSPDASRRNSVSAESEKLLGKRGVTARDAAAFLAKREQLLTQR